MWSVQREQWADIDRKELVKEVFFLVIVVVVVLFWPVLAPFGGEYCFWLLA